MRKFILVVTIFFASIFSASAYYMYCDDCWSMPVLTASGWVSVNWTYTGGGSNCMNSFFTGNMYPWSTAYVYLDGELIDIISFSNSSNVSCVNYV